MQTTTSHPTREPDGFAGHPARALDAPGMACVALTPLIADAMRDLRSGDVLEVRTDDVAARVGIPAWCRLTRNPLLGAVEDADPAGTTTVFHIRKKERRP